MPDVLQVQHPSPGKDNDPEWPQLSYGPGRVPRRPERARVALPWQALALLLAFVLIVLGFGWWRYEAYCASYNNPCWWHAPAITNALVLAGVVGVFGWVVARLRIWHAQAEAERNEARQLAVRTNRYGDAEPLALYEQPIQEAVQLFMARYLAATQLERDIAPHKRYSGVETLNEGAHTEIKTDLAPPALPEPPAEGPDPFQQFWARMRDATHIAILGMSKHGKTTLARAFLADCVERGEQVMAISLAADRVDWPIPVIGDGGEAAIVQALAAIQQELERREKARERDATPIRIFVDELTSATANKRVYEAWERIMSSFMTRSRHVQMYLVVMAHDNTSGVFAAVGKARLIRNFMQVWCIKEGGRHVVRIDDGLTIDGQGRQVRKVWQLDDTTPILNLAQRVVSVPPHQVFLTEDDLLPLDDTPPDDTPPDVLPPDMRSRPARAQVAWLAANTQLSTRQIRAIVGCDYNLVVDVTGKVRGPRGARLRAQLRRAT